MPVCPRSVSCHPMGSMSFKALQAQPLPHCRSHDRSLSRETASSSSKTIRRRTTGTTQVSHVISVHLRLTGYLHDYYIFFLFSYYNLLECICFNISDLVGDRYTVSVSLHMHIGGAFFHNCLVLYCAHPHR